MYIDADLDIALAKVEGKDFPHLSLADAATVRQGENVLAIGNPGDAMLFSVTKGIVSAVGKFANAGPGTWIQTDTPINPGNSGGPLLNSRGEVIGIDTQKLVKKNVTGIGFALSATDLLEVLHRFYPSISPLSVSESAGSSATHVAVPENDTSSTRADGSPAMAAAARDGKSQPDSNASFSVTQTAGASTEPFASQLPHGFGTVAITSEPDDAEIYVDGQCSGKTETCSRKPYRGYKSRWICRMEAHARNIEG